MAGFMRMKYQNPKLKHSQISNQLSYSTGTLQRHRSDINMLSSYRTQPNNTDKRTRNVSKTIIHNNSHCENEHNRFQVTSKDLKRPQLILKSNP